MAARYFGMSYRYCVVPGCEKRHQGRMVFCWYHTSIFCMLSWFGAEGDVADRIHDWWCDTEGKLRPWRSPTGSEPTGPSSR